jgi:hypothetical protein
MVIDSDILKIFAGTLNEVEFANQEVVWWCIILQKSRWEQ